MTRPRIFVGMATLEYMFSRTAFSFASVVQHTSRHADTLFAHGESNSLPNSLSGFVHTARQYQCSHIMLMEHDHTWPTDTILRLLAHDKDVVGCTYGARNPPHRVHGVELHDKGIDLNNQTFRKVKRLPMGALLIRLSVMDNWEQPLFTDRWLPDRNQYSPCDYPFCDRLREQGTEIWLDPKLSCEVAHIGCIPIVIEPDAVREEAA